jgi:hypothetical protein
MKNKNQQTKEDVFMQIEDMASRETFMLKAPANYGKLLDAFGRGETEQDYRNDQAILKLFCDTYAAFCKKKREDFEVVLNSGVACTDTFADLVTLALQMHKYYRLKGIAPKERLGRIHILSAKANNIENWVAKSPIEKAYEVGAAIQKKEGGKFYNGDYIGVCTCVNDTDN